MQKPIFTVQEQLETAFKVLSEIEAVGSTNAKKEILKQYSENSVLKRILESAYNPFRQYYIKKVNATPAKCSGVGVSSIRFYHFIQLLDELADRELTGGMALVTMENFLTSCSAEEFKWYYRVLQKDLVIGMADKGINSVIKGLIPTYEVLLADKITPSDLENRDPKTLKKIPKQFYTQYKIDGYRLNIWVHENGDIEIRTRNGKTVTGYTELEKEAQEKLPKGYVYDGEVVAPELFDWIESNKNNKGVTANRELFTEVMSHAFKKEDNKKGIFNLFDMIPIKEWNDQAPTETLTQRLTNIETMINSEELQHIKIVPTSRLYDNSPYSIEKLLAEFREFLRIGFEGIMIKDANAKYEFKRSKSLIKMKQMDNIDLSVTGIFEGEGKYKGMMGGVYVDYKGYQVGVGSGWSDEQRIKYFNNPNLIVGKTIEVKYQAESKNKNGGLSLSFPVVVQVREDK